MCRRTLKRFAFVALLSLVALPAFAGNDCKKCFVDSWGGSTLNACADPQSGQWGNSGCKVLCDRRGQDVYCYCDDTSGWGCLYEVVQG